MSLDVWGHMGYVLIASGMAFLAAKNRLGWVLRFLGESIWIGVGVALGMSSIWFWGFVFLLIDLNGYWRWSNGDKD
jgi:hypothetical protein